MSREKAEMKVATKTVPGKLAGAIVGVLTKEDKDVDISCIGAGAVNQAIKAVAIARGIGAPMGVDIVVVPYFLELDKGKPTTSIHILVQKR